MLEFAARFWEFLVRRIDRSLFGIVMALVAVGFVTLFSAADQNLARVGNQLASLVVALVAMWVVANIPPQTLARAAVPLYVLAVVLLVGVALFGVVVNGSRRWLNLGITRIQPSELMKIALPLMLAWYFQKFEGRIGWKDFLLAAVLIAIPAILVKRQPDLGTALLLISSGFFVLYLAGLSWKIIVGLFVAVGAAAPVLYTALRAGAAAIGAGERDPAAVATAVEMLLSHEQLTVQDSEVVAAAVAQFRQQPRVGFSDCLMVEIARKAGHTPLGTFDRDLGKVDGAHKL